MTLSCYAITCTVINQVQNMDKTLKRQRNPVQVLLSEEQQRRLLRIVEYRGVDRSAVIRNWIESAYSRLPEDAK
jgi:hypothetical protein